MGGIDTTANKTLAANLLDLLFSVPRFLHGLYTGESRGFDGYGGVTYKKVQGDEFELAGPDHDESLNDFIDEAEHDDYAPRVYDSAAEEKKFHAQREEQERGGMLSGGLEAARVAVPILAAPGAVTATVLGAPDESAMHKQH